MCKNAIVDALSNFLPPSAVVAAPADMQRYTVDQRDLLRGRSRAVVIPRSVDEVVSVVRLSGELGFSIVPQGGNTSYCGGATPSATGEQVIMSFERLNRIRRIDPLGYTASVDAGIILHDVHAAVAEHDLAFGLSLGAQGSCQIGGNIASNAGGVSVLRYGMARDLVLGLEVVLPDGQVLSDMSRLRKNNTGYDLKQLFVGSEGTLGFITGAVLKLHPLPRRHATLWVQLPRDPPLPAMLDIVRRSTADLVSSFEFISPGSLQLVSGGDDTLRGGEGGALLLELSASAEALPLEDLAIGAISALMEREWAVDAQLAANERQRGEIWKRRETLPEGEKRAGGSVKHDISVPLELVPTFLLEGSEAVRNYDPELSLSIYGHVGDGNLHFNVMVPRGEDRLAFSSRVEQELSPRLFDIALRLGGTFSAEHGVGRLKRPLYERYVDPAKRRLASRIKAAIDPENRFNTGAVTDPL